MTSKKQRTFFGQPMGLLNIFSTELCERFSYYGMRAILVFYLYAKVTDGGLGITETNAMIIMSLFGSLVYLSSIVGGWLADRVLGPYKSVLFGGIIIAAGHLVLGVPLEFTGTIVALALIVLGTGLLKPNVSVMVGGLYSDGDTRRQAGFSLLYMSINIGSFISPLVVGYVSQISGYHIAFMIPAAFMIIGLVVYVVLGKAALADIGKKPTDPLSSAERKKWIIIAGIAVVAIIAIAIILNVFGLLDESTLGNSVAVICAIIAISLFIFIFRDKRISKLESSRVISYIPLFLSATIFFAISEQQSSTIPLIVDNYVFNDLGFFQIPPSWYASLNPLVIIFLSPVFAAIWTKLGLKQPSITIKMAIGIFLAGIGFVSLGLPFLFITDGELISPIWPLLSLFFITVGELFLSPTGLSATTLLSPKIHMSKMMGLWFIAVALGQGLNALTVQSFNPENPSDFYFIYAVIAVVIGVVVCLLNKRMIALAGGIK